MYLSGLQQLFLLLSFIGGCSCRNVYIIGVMASVRTEPDCKTINPDRIKMIEAAYWLIDLLNNNPEQNISFEIQTVDICEHLSAVPATLALINQYRNGPKRLIGIVTHSTSANVMMISQTINSLPEENRIIQVGVAATAIELNNRLKYPNLFCVLPDDRTQMKMICNAFVQIQWNYIVLLYEDDVYGRQGAELFSKCAKEAKIHIRAKLEINTRNLEHIRYDLLKVSGVFIIAQIATVKKFFEKDRFRRKMSYMMSETTTMHTSLFEVHRNGAFLIVQKAFFKNQKFEQHWKNLFKQTPENITSKNPFFQNMIEEISQCSLLNNSCDMENTSKLLTSKMSEFYSTEAIVTGLYAITSNLGMILEKSCSSDPACPSLFKEGIKAFQEPINYVFLKNELGYDRMNIVTPFNANGTLENPPGWILYQLYYRKYDKTTGKFSFTKIGNYSSNGLKLSTNIIPGFDKYGNRILVKSVTCEPGFNCKDHQKTPDYIYKKGDILFVGVVPIHTRNPSQSYSCGNIRKVSGVSLAEAMLFAIKELNERRTYKNIFPGKKIGILILDTCSSDIIILRKLFALQSNDAVICGTHLNCSEIGNKVIVYIGALLSQVSLAVSKMMTAENRVQISFGSTSNRLSDREEHPNFLRICTSDEEQMKAIIDLLVKFNWKYISIVYKDDLYGSSFKESFLDKSKEHDICAIRAIPYTEGVDFATILTKIRQRPEAEVIVLFIGSNQINTFLQGFTEIMRDNEFIFIGSEAWSNKILLDEKVSKKIEGSITLGLEIQENTDFIEYTKEKILKENDMSEWLQNYIELTCYLPLSLNKMSNIPCPLNYTLYQSEMKSVWIPFVIDAINAAAIGLNQSITQTCSDGLVCPKLFERVGQLIQNIKNVQLTKTSGKFRVFNSNGDGVLNYIIYKLELNGMYTKVGHWSNADGIVFNRVFKPPLESTECPNRKHCSECLYVKKNEQIYEKEEKEDSYVAVLVVFILLLLVLITIVIVIVCCARKKHPKQVRNQPEGGRPSEQYSCPNDEINMEGRNEEVIPKVIDDGD